MTLESLSRMKTISKNCMLIALINVNSAKYLIWWTPGVAWWLIVNHLIHCYGLFRGLLLLSLISFWLLLQINDDNIRVDSLITTIWCHRNITVQYVEIAECAVILMMQFSIYGNTFVGNYENLLSSLSYSMTDTCSTLTRHSSYTWLRDEEEDTCLLATQLRRRYEEVRRSAMEHGGVGDILAEEPECCFSSEQVWNIFLVWEHASFTLSWSNY